MRSDFADLCKDAWEGIAIPAVPLDAIQCGAIPQPPRQRRTLAAVVLVATSLLAAAVSAQVLGGTRFFFAPGGGLSMQFSEREVKLAPTNANLQAAIAQADFRVTLPTGLPPGAALNDLARIGRSVLVLGYRVPAAPRPRNDVLILLVGTANVGAIEKVGHNASTYRVNVRRMARGSHWRVGAEDVIVVSHGGLSPAQVKHVKDAMLRAAAQETAH